jgi:hypothetical protein
MRSVMRLVHRPVVRSIREHVDRGIDNIRELHGALQLAIQLEFATIPPYLCAQWSVRRDPDRVEGVLHRIVNDEMTHLALAGNVLAATGGLPRLAYAGFVPTYPLHALPGGISQPFPIDLTPLTHDQVAVFMQIEHPEFPRPAVYESRGIAPPASIGDFYNTIIAGLKKLEPDIVHAPQVPVKNMPPVRSIDGAIRALESIKEEGEGLEDSPIDPTSDRTTAAHYFAFKEIYLGKRLMKDDTGWHFSGPPVQMPEVYRFADSVLASAEKKEFSRTLSQLLLAIESCWERGGELDVASMFELQITGVALIRRGVRPEFAWDASTINQGCNIFARSRP